MIIQDESINFVRCFRFFLFNGPWPNVLSVLRKCNEKRKQSSLYPGKSSLAGNLAA
jgi:hypothetical protein